MYKHFSKELLRGKVSLEGEVELLYRKLYDVFVEPFDAHDNGISAYPEDVQPRFHRPWDLFAQVNILNPAWNEEGIDIDARFAQAVSLCVKTLSMFLIIIVLLGYLAVHFA